RERLHQLPDPRLTEKDRSAGRQLHRCRNQDEQRRTSDEERQTDSNVQDTFDRAIPRRVSEVRSTWWQQRLRQSPALLVYAVRLRMDVTTDREGGNDFRIQSGAERPSQPIFELGAAHRIE